MTDNRTARMRRAETGLAANVDNDAPQPPHWTAARIGVMGIAQHNIAGEAYVVVPDGFEAFAALEGVEAKTVKHRIARLGRHRERSSPTGAANTFRAELADGRRAEGMVFDGELIWDDDPPPEADGRLGRRRR